MGTFTEKILAVLQDGAETTVDLLDITLTPKGKAFYRKVYRSSLYGPKRFKSDWAEWYRKRQSFYSLLNQLKREGLVEKKGFRKKTVWHITPNGQEKLRTGGSKPERRPAGILMRVYPKKQSAGIVIVAFDIPEKMRKKRDWLRENLIALDLRLLQKSVWIGNTRIPQDFITDLRAQNILPFVHIFSIDKQGSLRQVRSTY
ncbi:MAG: hypothetical protein AAB533_01770 [Patescibacteria group bacterium]